MRAGRELFEAAVARGQVISASLLTNGMCLNGYKEIHYDFAAFLSLLET